jgi:energy-converting hydrogenase Eha subunit G
VALVIKGTTMTTTSEIMIMTETLTNADSLPSFSAVELEVVFTDQILVLILMSSRLSQETISS